MPSVAEVASQQLCACQKQGAPGAAAAGLLRTGAGGCRSSLSAQVCERVGLPRTLQGLAELQEIMALDGSCQHHFGALLAGQGK